MQERALDPTEKNYLDLPGSDKNKKIQGPDRKISLKESTQVFEHYLEPGQKPDLQDILTNPKFGNSKRTNVIYEHSTGKPEDSITEKPVVNHVTEEWVDDRKHQSRFKPEDVNYNLMLSSKDLETLPPLFNKDFAMPDADIHLTIDKTALEGARGGVSVKKEAAPEGERKLYVDAAPQKKQSWGGLDDDADWKKAFDSFDDSKGNILDADVAQLDPSRDSLESLAPSSFSMNLDSFSGNPKENLEDMMGGVSENDLLNEFVGQDSKGFAEDNEDLLALKKFQRQMGEGAKGAKRVPILI